MSAAYVIGGVHFIFICFYFLRSWMRGPTTGSDNPKRLDGKLVVITGKKQIHIQACLLGMGKFSKSNLG